MPNLRDSQQDYFRKRGIVTRNQVRERMLFVGRNSRFNFGQMGEFQAAKFTAGNESNVAALGEAYNNGHYKTTTGSEARTYEAVYGDWNFSVPVTDDPANRQKLDIVYGNNDKDPTGESSDVNTTEAPTTIGASGTVTLNRSSLVERNRMLRLAQAGVPNQLDEDIRGIRGVEEQDAPIEPIL